MIPDIGGNQNTEDKSMAGTEPAQAPLNLLHVEDSPEDYILTARALLKSGYDVTIRWIDTADEAQDFLDSDSAPEDRPGLILLDLDLPGTDGRAFLRWLKSQPKLQMTPVIILSSSERPEDVRNCYAEGAAGYVVKPTNPADMKEAVSGILDYWAGTVLRPGNHPFRQVEED